MAMASEAQESFEEVDAVIVGARCAGSATAIALARRGRSVLVLDGASFPSGTKSTHLFFPPHVAELDRLGVREAVEELGAPRHRRASLTGGDQHVEGPFSAFDGFAYGSCVRREGLDEILVNAAREAGAEVRERTRVTDLVRGEGGRVTGVRWRDRDGETGVVLASLVVGADGRHSSVAEMVGARKHHEWENRRLMAFAYYRDTHAEDREVSRQWRQGTELGTVFPCDQGLSLVLLMSPAQRADEFREDRIGTFERTIASIPPMAARLDGCTRETKLRTSYRHPAYFRHSSGPGWALAGDAGHFKDPVVAQGIRDALRFGRLLGEAAAPVIEDSAALDAATRAWEEERDRQCLDTYQWANTLGMDDTISPLEAAAYRWFAERPGGATELLDVFSRKRLSRTVFSPARAAVWSIQAARRPPERAGLGSTLKRDAQREIARYRERVMFERIRATTRRSTSPPPDAQPRSEATPASPALPV